MSYVASSERVMGTSNMINLPENLRNVQGEGALLRYAHSSNPDAFILRPAQRVLKCLSDKVRFEDVVKVLIAWNILERGRDDGRSRSRPKVNLETGVKGPWDNDAFTVVTDCPGQAVKDTADTLQNDEILRAGVFAGKKVVIEEFGKCLPQTR
jgi:hypothetical protein